MDKSPEYIKMCGLATEIQQRWQQAYGDFYVGENGRIECWIPKRRQSVVVKKGFGVCSQRDVIRIVKYTWLPRQDQLIEIAQEKGRRYESVTQEFFDWAKTVYTTNQEPPSKLFRTMEKVWLAFVMHKNFWKKWNGAAWSREFYRRPQPGG
jgi:hypothetical protein